MFWAIAACNPLLWLWAGAAIKLGRPSFHAYRRVAAPAYLAVQRDHIARVEDEERLYRKINELVNYFVTAMSQVGNPGLVAPPRPGTFFHYPKSECPLRAVPTEVRANAGAWWSMEGELITTYACITPDGQWEYLGDYRYYKDFGPDTDERLGYWVLSSKRFQSFYLVREENYGNGPVIKAYGQYLGHNVDEEMTASVRAAHARICDVIVKALHTHNPAALAALPR